MKPAITFLMPAMERQITDRKWPTLIALPILIGTAFYEVYSAWGALFVFWAVRSIVDRKSNLVEPIELDRNPALFWIIIGLWMSFGLLYMLADVMRQF